MRQRFWLEVIWKMWMDSNLIQYNAHVSNRWLWDHSWNCTSDIKAPSVLIRFIVDLRLLFLLPNMQKPLQGRKYAKVVQNQMKKYFEGDEIKLLESYHKCNSLQGDFEIDCKNCASWFCIVLLKSFSLLIACVFYSKKHLNNQKLHKLFECKWYEIFEKCVTKSMQ